MPRNNLTATTFPNQPNGSTNYQYYDPQTQCDHPAYIQVRQVIHNNIMAVADVTERGVPKKAIRWNIADAQFNDANCQSGKVPCLGYPYSNGYPTWFVLPAGAFINQNGNLEISLV